MAGAMRILADRGGVVFVDKPAGLPSTGRDLDDPNCVQRRLQEALGRRVWAAHQLDRGTSGVLVFVTRRSLVAPTQQALARGRKRYLALAHGRLAEPRRVIEAPLRYVRRQARPAVVPDGKYARTEVLLRQRGERASLVEARPRTGRTHQIRVHLAHVGHPIVGDALHGLGPAARLGLHCWRLRLEGEWVEAPVPADFRSLGEELGLSLAGQRSF